MALSSPAPCQRAIIGLGVREEEGRAWAAAMAKVSGTALTCQQRSGHRKRRRKKQTKRRMELGRGGDGESWWLLHCHPRPDMPAEVLALEEEDDGARIEEH